MGPRFRKMRILKGMSQQQLAAAAGVGQATISRIEEDPGAVATHRLMKVCEALDIRVTFRRSHPWVDSSAQKQGQ